MGTATAADDVQLAPPPGGELFHLGRRPEPFWWHLPEPLDLTADPIQTAAGRFDDPDGKYATLYCATDYYRVRGRTEQNLALRARPWLAELGMTTRQRVRSLIRAGRVSVGGAGRAVRAVRGGSVAA